MCGRYTLAADFPDLTQTFPHFSFSDDHSPRYNISPTQSVLAVANDDRYYVENFRWGLIPYWAESQSVGSRMINARSETLAEKPSFKIPYQKQGCLILADGFYEWVKDKDGSKTPFYIHLSSNKVFTFAGPWESWLPPNGNAKVKSCTIINTRANKFMSNLHHRMPVIIEKENHDRWLSSRNCKPDDLVDLLTPYQDDDLVAYPVSKRVNSPRNDDLKCIKSSPEHNVQLLLPF